ncbi:LamG-like jellyroll fold domain-containing protein [Candidatus Omnitrophota bacterium]
MIKSEKFSTIIIVLSTLFFFTCTSGDKTEETKQTDTGPAESIVWNIDNLTNIGGHPVTVEGEPKVIDTPKGKAVEFDGVDDALFVDVHPLEGVTAYTYEVIFCPYSDGPEEQRFFHLQENDTNNRFLLETRIIGGNTWCLDSFMAAGETNQTLIDRSLTHPTDEWYSVALVFDGKEMAHYINGVKELSAQIETYVPPKAGRTSMGVRINKVHWFKGAFRKARFTRRALSPEELLRP